MIYNLIGLSIHVRRLWKAVHVDFISLSSSMERRTTSIYHDNIKLDGYLAPRKLYDKQPRFISELRV